MLWFILFLIAYLLGAFPTGFLLARSKGLNIQQFGSGNIGATNVLRILGIEAALLVVLVDVLKGALPTTVALLFGFESFGASWIGLAAVLGHNFNPFLKFKGGKGIATSLGVAFILFPLIALLVTSLGVFTITISRYVSLGSLVGIVSFPLFLLVAKHYLLIIPTLVFVILAILSHLPNLSDLAKGTERQLGINKDSKS